MKELIDKLKEELIAEVLQEITRREPPQKAVLDAKETAQYIGYSLAWVRTHKNELPAPLQGEKIRYLKTDLDEWLQSQRKETVQPHKIGKVSMRQAYHPKKRKEQIQ